MNVNKVCNWSLKSRYSKVDLTKKEIFKKKDMTPQFRQMSASSGGILKLTKIKDHENFEQLDEQNEGNIVTNKHHKPASLHIFSNKFVNKVTLDQIVKNYFTTYNRRLANFDDGTPVDKNDVSQQSMIWQVQDRTKTHYDYTYYSARDYAIGNRIELTNNKKGVFFLNIRTYY
ncbi:hypothetical protein RFI_04390, partial [Reticulomyxa filosa]